MQEVLSLEPAYGERKRPFDDVDDWDREVEDQEYGVIIFRLRIFQDGFNSQLWQTSSSLM